MAGGAPKGHRKWGGRAKGTPNKNTNELFKICEKHKCSPFEGMVIIAMETKDPDKKFDRFAKISEYLYPKRKAIEHSLDDDPGVAERLRLARERLNSGK